MDFQELNQNIENSITALMKIEEREQFIDGVSKLSALLIELNYPFVPDLLKRVKATPDGQTTMTVRTFNGKVQTLVTTEMTKHSYK